MGRRRRSLASSDPGVGGHANAQPGDVRWFKDQVKLPVLRPVKALPEAGMAAAFLYSQQGPD